MVPLLFAFNAEVASIATLEPVILVDEFDSKLIPPLAETLNLLHSTLTEPLFPFKVILILDNKGVSVWKIIKVLRL